MKKKFTYVPSQKTMKGLAAEAKRLKELIERLRRMK